MFGEFLVVFPPITRFINMNEENITIDGVVSIVDGEEEEEILYIVCMAACTIGMVMEFKHPQIMRDPTNLNKLREQFLSRLYKESDRVCHENLRMNRTSFRIFCNNLRLKGLCDGKFVTVEEQVAIFLFIIGHDVKNRNANLNFIRSGETVSRYFNVVLRAVLKMQKDLLKPPDSRSSPNESTHPKTWHHYFKDAVGAIDGTYIHATVPTSDQPRFRNRKGDIRQNVLVACSFNMRIMYVLAGWEGSAHDGRVLKSALRSPIDPLTVPTGKYYLGDAGFPNAPGFMTPYRGVRYHLNEHRGRLPANAKELFNYRHSSLRNVIERCFGLLKKRFACLRTFTFYDFKTQVYMVIACCIIHNHIMNVDPLDMCDEDPDPLENTEFELLPEEQSAILVPTLEWSSKRDQLASNMWEEYRRRRHT